MGQSQMYHIYRCVHDKGVEKDFVQKKTIQISQSLLETLIPRMKDILGQKVIWKPDGELHNWLGMCSKSQFENRDMLEKCVL